MIATKLPSVLQIPCSTQGYSNSLSVERVLKKALELIEAGIYEGIYTGDRLEQANVTVEDLEDMIKRIG